MSARPGEMVGLPLGGLVSLSVRLVAAAGVLVVAGLLVELVVSGSEAVTAVDARLAAWLRVPADAPVVWPSLVLGHLGHLTVAVGVIAAVGARAWSGSGRPDIALLLIAALGGATVVTAALKVVVDRGRPDDALAGTLTSAYPSGHAVRAAAVFGLVAWLLRRSSRWRVVRTTVVPVAVLLVVANAGARVALGVHWPSDVLVGIALGGAWAGVCWWLLGPTTRRGPARSRGRSRPAR